ncbi:branched-chain amino acid ABC transporter permease [Nesterenkonia salmonea]|uniref:Branched-chain amino acid ABC transporter permease n=1 Tax=Nesterenkonia salmonea TaxID=1804987 RepID=A0A5R9B9R4_9MICC|nr:branched-chain amino acid ABC transporter permease [Nesterenkonia salmonea]TLP93677.1 branched-chain amino acid ABC transporter permease [Nesterenkonia salmonea]
MKLTFSIRGVGALLVAAALLFAPLILAEQNYLLRVLITGITYAIAVYGLNIILGFTGQLSLAHGGFFGIGVYTMGLLTTDYDWSFWSALLAAIVLTTVVGFLAGLLALRTREAYFAIFTMALGLIIYMVISRWEDVTHAYSGVLGVKLPEDIGPLDFSEPATYYYLLLVFLAAAAYVTYTLRVSNVGRRLLAIRTSEDLASSIGINVGLNKQLAFTASAGFAGLGGALFASAEGFIGPNSSSIDLTFELLMFLLVGGVATVMGPIVGTLLVLMLFEAFQDFQAYRFILLGPVIIALVIYAPQGLIGRLNQLTFYWKRRRAAAQKTAAGAPEQNSPADPHDEKTEVR